VFHGTTSWYFQLSKERELEGKNSGCFRKSVGYQENERVKNLRTMCDWGNKKAEQENVKESLTN